MTASTATVEVLTAEVRVLMVGSRQITLSVARQLDWVSATDLEPFGRIRLGNDDEDRNVTVIGSASGTLARACIYQHHRLCGPELLATDHTIYYCAEHNHPEGQTPPPWERHYWAAYFSEQQRVPTELWKQFTTLPLIVLAGLR